MAEVFLARRRGGGGIEKRLVLKRIRSERAADPRWVSLFVREARVSMALSHQNIVPVFDFGRADDALFLAMELVDGRDLGAVLAAAHERAELMDPLLIAFVGAECCAALAYAHARSFEDGTVGVVHRDVTPRNILVSWSGEVRLTDFGVAALRSETDPAVRGTPSYMAPEQARGETVDGRADLYALGMVLLEAATGACARPTDHGEALAAARVGARPTVAPLAGGLDRVIAKALAPEPFDRYPNARAMRDALDRVVTTLRADRGAPSHLLADWLRALFGPPSSASGITPLPQPVDAVTFLDDGEDAVLGTGTARSIAGTVAETPPPAAPPSAPLPRRRLLWPALAGIAALASTAIIWITTRAPAPALAPDAAAAAAPDAAAAAAPDAAAAAAPDAAAAAASAAPTTPPDTTTSSRTRTRRTTRAPAPETQAIPTPAPRHVTIGSRPWSAFWIDAEPTRHETPETIDLLPGKHRIHFVNETAHVDRTITLDVPPDRDIKHVETLVPDGP